MGFCPPSFNVFRTKYRDNFLGHYVLKVQEAGNANQKITEEQILAFAVSQERAVLTLNRYKWK